MIEIVGAIATIATIAEFTISETITVPE